MPKFAALKRAKRNIFYAKLLLLMFCAGQYMAFAHTHVKQISFSNETQKQAVLKERCDVCDIMHHAQEFTALQIYLTPAITCITLYTKNTPAFTPIQLVLAAGRAPPVAC